MGDNQLEIKFGGVVLIFRAFYRGVGGGGGGVGTFDLGERAPIRLIISW